MDTVEELTQIQKRLIDGWVAGDPSTHERVLDDGWTLSTRAEMS